MIQCKHIVKTYKNTGTILKDITFEVPKGAFTALIGRSGCGKTTLLNIIGLLDAPSSGTLLIEGLEATALSVKARDALRKNTVGYITQMPYLLNNRTVYDNVAAPLYYRNFTKAEIEKRTLKVISELGLDARCNEPCKHLSGGERQRVAIARTLVSEPTVLLADEPSGSVDVQTEAQIMHILKDQATKGCAVLMVTHNLNLLDCCNKVIEIQDGSIPRT